MPTKKRIRINVQQHTIPIWYTNSKHKKTNENDEKMKRKHLKVIKKRFDVYFYILFCLFFLFFFVGFFNALITIQQPKLTQFANKNGKRIEEGNHTNAYTAKNLKLEFNHMKSFCVVNTEKFSENFFAFSFRSYFERM